MFLNANHLKKLLNGIMKLIKVYQVQFLLLILNIYLNGLDPMDLIVALLMSIFQQVVQKLVVLLVVKNIPVVEGNQVRILGNNI